MTTFFPAGVPNQSASGTLTNVNDAVILATDSLGTVDFALAGSPVGATVAFESTSDGTNWVASKAYQKGGTSAAGSTTATAAGVYNVSVGGAKQVRVRLSAVTSGSFAVVANGTAAVAHVGVKNANPADLQATITPSGATLTDRSGSVATGGTAQQLAAANTARKGWRFQNTSAADLWFNDTGSAASIGGAGSFRVVSLGYYETPVGGASQAAISVYGATTGQTFSASEW
jgi:hypothetical protein